MGHKEYHEYLRTRGHVGLFYRHFFLYPVICRFLHGRAIDYGCGIGDFLRFRSNTVGVDINPYAIDWCRKLGVDAVLIQDLPLPFHDNEFDGAVMDNVIEHIHNPRPILEELSRVLVKDGKLVVGVPGRRGYQHDSDHKQFYDEKSLSGRLHGAGFQRDKVFHMPIKSSVLDDKLRQYCIYGVFRNLKRPHG
jgi:SAM-dependent methyltransferase